MNDLRSYAVFAEVVATGSMSAAARHLGLTPSAVSQIISNLERQVGIGLLHRSTRKIALTEAGERCYPHCLQLLEAGKAAQASLLHARDAPGGELRIAAPLGFGIHIAPALSSVFTQWPHLRLGLIVDDALIDLFAARIDIALRVGELPDSTWVGRKLCDMETVLCASPAYLERHGTPNAVEDLPHHQWLALTHQVRAPAVSPVLEATTAATFSLALLNDDGARAPLTLPARATTTNQIALQQLCEQSMGIAHLFYADVRPALEHGRLIRVLPHTRLPTYALTLLTAGREREPAKVRVAIEALRAYFASMPMSALARSSDRLGLHAQPGGRDVI